MSTRDPYPFEKFQNDDNFLGPQMMAKKSYGEPEHIAQKKQPWNRLYNNCTLASSRREIYHHDPDAPRDSLDFVIKSEYNQHKEFLKGKNEVLFQKETLGIQHGRILKNKEIVIQPPAPKSGHPIRVTENPNREHLDTVDMIIEGPHIQTTNRGYSRKPDGGFFTT
jgi:hypothetical protein